MKLDLRDLQYFAVIGEHRHLGLASEALGLSQPALSKSLRRLERAAEAKLVRKTARGVDLTAVGVAFLDHARRIRLAVDDAARELSEVSRGRIGRVRLGANYYFCEHVIAEACSAFLDEAPQTSLHVVAAANDVLVPALRSGQLDLILSTLPLQAEDDLEHVPLYALEFVVCAAPSHPLAQRKRLSVQDLRGEGWALSPDVLPSRWLLQAFEALRMPGPRIALETTSLELRRRAVSSSRLLGFFPRVIARQSASPYPLAPLEVKDLVWDCPVGFRYRKDAYLPPAARRFADKLRSIKGTRAAS
jgi:DNA-binding transcriptional LysR family regulator